MDLPQLDNYHDLLVNDTPLIDVRAPIEFEQGAFPHAQNLPLLNDEERHLIGIRYKEQGQEQAINLGQELVSNDIKQTRVSNWTDFTKLHPKGALYCFRGGLRSKISQQWIYEATGVIYPRISGGYKSLRRFLIDELERSAETLEPLVLGGRTGTGKTILLNKIEQQIDLEGIYNHRGSAFGKQATPQPGQIDIENKLSIALLKQRQKKFDKLVFEDEAPNIGSRQLPKNLFNSMSKSPLILLEAEITERINNVFHEYVTESLAQHKSHFGEEKGFEAWVEVPQTALHKIQRRLGGVRYKELKTIMDHAIACHRESGNMEFHKEWIKILLQDYYDPMYDYQLSKKTERITFRGDSQSVLDYLKEQHDLS